MPIVIPKNQIRAAANGDGPEIANVHLNSWRETYAGLLPAEYLARMPLTFKSRVNHWSRTVTEKVACGTIYLGSNKSKIALG